MILTSLIFATIQFPAGSVVDFASKLAKETARPCVIVLSPMGSHPAFSGDPASASEFARIVRASVGLVQAPGTDFNFSDGMTARSLIKIPPVWSSAPVGPLTGDAGIEFSGGQVNVNMERCETTFESLRQRKWSTKTEWHWTLDRYAVVLSKGSYSEADLIVRLAKAGGMIQEKFKDSLRLRVNPAEFRRRSLATIAKYADSESLKRQPQMTKWKLEMVQYALAMAPDRNISEAFEFEGASSRMQLDTGAKQALSQKFLRMSREASTLVERGNEREDGRQTIRPITRTEAGMTFAGSPSAVGGFAERVDWQQPMYLILKSDFGVSLTGLNGRSGSRTQISLEF